jgi:biotin carboxyl carrier protein
MESGRKETIMKRTFDIDLQGAKERVLVEDGRVMAVAPGNDNPRSIKKLGAHQYLVEFANGVVPVAIARSGSGYAVQVRGVEWYAIVRDEHETLRLKLRGSRQTVSIQEVRAPMPALVARVLVEPGATIGRGETLVVLEAMKMENDVRAPRDAVVDKVLVKGGTTVEKDQVLMSLR